MMPQRKHILIGIKDMKMDGRMDLSVERMREMKNKVEYENAVDEMPTLIEAEDE